MRPILLVSVPASEHECSAYAAICPRVTKTCIKTAYHPRSLQQSAVCCIDLCSIFSVNVNIFELQHLSNGETPHSSSLYCPKLCYSIHLHPSLYSSYSCSYEYVAHSACMCL